MMYMYCKNSELIGSQYALCELTKFYLNVTFKASRDLNLTSMQGWLLLENGLNLQLSDFYQNIYLLT